MCVPTYVYGNQWSGKARLLKPIVDEFNNLAEVLNVVVTDYEEHRIKLIKIQDMLSNLSQIATHNKNERPFRSTYK